MIPEIKKFIDHNFQPTDQWFEKNAEDLKNRIRLAQHCIVVEFKRYADRCFDEDRNKHTR